MNGLYQIIVKSYDTMIWIFVPALKNSHLLPENHLLIIYGKISQPWLLMRITQSAPKNDQRSPKINEIKHLRVETL